MFQAKNFTGLIALGFVVFLVFGCQSSSSKKTAARAPTSYDQTQVTFTEEDVLQQQDTEQTSQPSLASSKREAGTVEGPPSTSSTTTWRVSWNSSSE